MTDDFGGFLASRISYSCSDLRINDNNYHAVESMKSECQVKIDKNIHKKHDDQYEPAWVQKKEELSDAASQSHRTDLQITEQ